MWNKIRHSGFLRADALLIETEQYYVNGRAIAEASSKIKIIRKTGGMRRKIHSIQREKRLYKNKMQCCTTHWNHLGAVSDPQKKTKIMVGVNMV